MDRQLLEPTEEILPAVIEQFGEDYYLRGEELGLSGYQDYSWRPDETLPMASYMKRFMGIKDGNSLLDVGAARGYLVKAMRMMGVEAYGHDISQWAVENCDPSMVDYMSTELKADPMSYDFVVSKDCMEHIPEEELGPLLKKLFEATRKALLIIVPLAGKDGGQYLCPRDEGDPTHKVRWTFSTWVKFVSNIERRAVCSGSLYVPGIKQANVQWEGSCGFVMIRRM